MLTCASEVDRQENQNSRDADRRIESRAEHKSVFTPPRESLLANQPSKGQPYHSPAAVIHSRGGRKIVQSTQEQGNVNLLPERVGVSATEIVNRDGQDCSNDEEVQEGRVADLTLEKSPRTNGTPDEGSVEVCGGIRTAETVGCSTCTDTGDVIKRPVKDSDRRESSHDHADTLHQEKLSLRDLEYVLVVVMNGHNALGSTNIAIICELHVLREIQPLNGGDVPN